MQISEIEIFLKAGRESLPLLAEKLEQFAAESAISAHDLFRLNLVLEELIDNLVSYGYPDGRQGEILISIRSFGERVEIVMRDDGVPFDPFSRATPDLSAGIDERPIGGLGVHFVRTLADEARYGLDEGRNTVHLGFALDRPEPAPSATGIGERSK